MGDHSQHFWLGSHNTDPSKEGVLLLVSPSNKEFSVLQALLVGFLNLFGYFFGFSRRLVRRLVTRAKNGSVTSLVTRDLNLSDSKMKAQHLTFEEHQALGQELSVMNHRIQEIWVLLGNRIGTSKKPTVSALKCQKPLRQLRSDLDDLVCRQFPEMESSAVIGAYYPGSEMPK